MTLRLIGQLDSPYVRRVAVSLQLLGLPFRHEPLSVFRDVEAFRQINPVVKVPTLVCEDGTVLMDSTLILDLAEQLAGRSLMPAALPARQRALRLIGLALAACEKSVQVVYERKLRPAERQHGPWLERIGAQVLAAFDGLEAELQHQPLPVAPDTLDQAAISAAVAWRFAQEMIADMVPAARCPALAALSASAEALSVFQQAAYGEARAAAAVTAD